MKLLFIGGTGLISEAVSKLVVERGHELYLLNRGGRSEFVPPGAQVIFGDIRNAGTVATLLKELTFDVVVDWIAFTPEHVRTDIELFRGKTKQYVFISSASAYQKPPEHYLITESTPLENPYWQYSRDKIDCERLLLDEYENNGFPATIVRPSLTYGDTMIPAAINSWQQPWSIIDRMRKGKKIIVHGDGTSLWTVTHNTDFAVGLIGLLGNAAAIGEAFHITSDEVLTWNQIYSHIAAAAGVAPRLVHISSEFICSHSPEEVGGLLGDKAVSVVFDNSKLKRFVPGFQAVVPFSEGIKRTVAFFEANPQRCTVDTGWNEKMDRLIDAYESGLGPAHVKENF